LRDYVDQRLVDMQRAVDKAEQTINTRLEGMNEFRAAMKDQQAQMATKEDLANLRMRIDDLKEKASMAAGKADQQSVNRATAFAVIGIILAVASIIVRLV